MLHKHHSSHHAAGFLLGVLFVGSILGGMSGLFGDSLIKQSGALGLRTNVTERRAKLFQSRLNRRIQRALRLQRAEQTYPTHESTFAYKGSNSWDATLNTAMLSYERLGIIAPIGKPSAGSWNNRDWRLLEDQMQYLLLNGAAAYPHSVNPGEKGRVIVAGHSSPPTMEAIGSPYEDVFATLPSAQAGDIIRVGEYSYKVRRTQIVPATYTQILRQSSHASELILFTCYPVGTTRERFVVWADLVEGNAVANR